VYDRRACTYLFNLNAAQVPRHFRDTSETLRKYRFNLNAAQVVDACPKGNMSRFANHSDKANCDTKIMTVRGDQHIGLYAKERIGRGEEIFFNYRWDEAIREKHGFEAGRGGPRKRLREGGGAAGGRGKGARLVQVEGGAADGAAGLLEHDAAGVDHRLGGGAYASGWRIREAYLNARKNGEWKYVCPAGQSFRSRSEAVQARAAA
jgi:hypothetical protein